MLSSNLTTNSLKSRRSKGLLQASALLALSTVGAIALLPKAAPSANLAAGGNLSSSTSGSSTKTATSDAINYRYGTIQLSVTQSGGKLTAIDLVQAGATGGRESAFSYLVTDAINANGTSFGNMSGATFTVDAFKQALTSAISKL